MSARWIGCAPENFRAGRPAGFLAAAVVLHRSGGSLTELRARFASSQASTSAHYGVGRAGGVEQYVDEADTAFHAGIVVNASWARLRPRVNPNFYTIGIELEGAAGQDWPAAQVTEAAALIARIADRWAIDISSETVIAHTAIRASVSCPGATCPIDAVVAAARGHVVTPASTVVARVRAVANVKVRLGAPFRAAPVVRIIPAGTEVAVNGYTDGGERVSGNACWYVDGEGHFFWAGATDVPLPAPRAAGHPHGADGMVTTDGMEAGSLGPATAGDEVTIDRTSLALPADQYYAQRMAKDLLVLHFTAGTTARGAVQSWRATPAHVATAYVVDTDGTIYEVFPPECWAYHLGITGGTPIEKRSVGIEIVNVGPLQRVAGDTLAWWPNNWTQKFCTLDDSAKYTRSPYRQKEYFATFSEAQMEATARLVRQLCERFEVPRVIPGASKRLECEPGFAAYRGIATHANFRPDKWDIGPAFEWDRLGL